LFDYLERSKCLRVIIDELIFLIVKFLTIRFKLKVKFIRNVDVHVLLKYPQKSS